ncbi:hypothetical protein [Streptomyces sp. NPDC050504]|uniref:hypothetical protein n=1 Tax=Streptomyces sp. NPDC050504 TaxID=3365618 RepID=UPI0037BDC406
MDGELVALASTGGAALVQHMVSEGWAQARGLIARFIARTSGADEEAVEAELEASREDLTAARATGNEQTAELISSEVRTEWGKRMRNALIANPAAAADLRAILDELDPRSRAQQIVYNNTVNGGTHASVIQVGRVGTLNQGGAAPPAPRGPEGP